MKEFMSKYREININNEIFSYKVGRENLVIYNKNRKKFLVGINVILNKTFDDIARYRRKNYCSSNFDQSYNVTPSDVSKYILNNCFN
jgi:hypothetical protein